VPLHRSPHPRSCFTPEAASPRKVFTPEGSDADPRSGFGQTVKNHHLSGGFATSEDARQQGQAFPIA